METRFLAMDRCFDAVDDRFGEMLGHLDNIEHYAISQQLHRIEASLTDERARREMLEQDLAVLKEHIVMLQARLAEIERRLDI